MKKSIFTAIAALGLMGTAQADTVCKDCEYVYYGSYLNQYWPGDRATFGNRDLAHDLELMTGVGTSQNFNDYWVLDLNDAATISLTVNGRLAGPYFAVEIYADVGSVCGMFRCTIGNLDFLNPIVTQIATTRWSTTSPVLPPGRYVIRVAAQTRASGESSYRATMVVKAAP